MSNDERNWISEAMACCKSANEAKLTIALVRLQDFNNEADIVITNAAAPEMISAIAALIRSSVGAPDREVDES